MPRWTPEARQKHAEAIRQWLPWTRSTGPKTQEGKARSARNAWKGGLRPQILRWGAFLSTLCLANRTAIRSAGSKIRKPKLRKPQPQPVSPLLSIMKDMASLLAECRQALEATG